MPAIPYHTHASDSRALISRQLLPSLRHLARSIFTRANASTPQILQSHPIQARQNTIAIPTVYQGLDSGPPAGEVVGIVLGSVFGFILLIWLFSVVANNRNGGTVVEEEVIVRHERSPRSRKSRRSEMTSRSPRPERVIRQERIVRDTSRAPPRRSGFVVAEEGPERRVDGDDIVEVIEEGSSIAPPRKSKRGGYRDNRY